MYLCAFISFFQKGCVVLMSGLERIIGKNLSKDETAITYSDFNQEEVNKLFQNMRIYE